MAGEIEALAELARAGGRLGIDTEFVGERRYRALLCLAQVAVPDPAAPEGVRIDVIDTLDDSVDPSPLAGLLADPEIEVVVHAGRQDVALLRRLWQTEVNHIFDTQVAAGFVGLGTQTGYARLLASVLKVRVPDSASFTRWDKRPLTEEQLSYARDDVAHLLQLADGLQERLEERGRLEWAREECRFLEDMTDERDPERVFERLPRAARLKPRQRAVAREVAAWRERTAAHADRPVGTVLGDAPLVEIAKRAPTTERALAEIRGVGDHIVRRYGREIFAAVERGQAAPPIPVDAARVAPDQGDEALIALAQALARSHAVAAGISYELVASRDDLTQVVVAARHGAVEPDVRVLRGWRRGLVGDELLDLLAGRRALTVDGEGRLHVETRDGASG